MHIVPLVLTNPSPLSLGQALACWGVVWTILVTLPPGYTDQRCVIRMNMVSRVFTRLAHPTFLAFQDVLFWAI